MGSKEPSSFYVSKSSTLPSPRSPDSPFVESKSGTLPLKTRQDSTTSAINPKLDFGDLTISELDRFQSEILRRLTEKRVSGIIGDEKALELLRVPGTGSKVKYFLPQSSEEIKKSKGIFGMNLSQAVAQTGTSFSLNSVFQVTLPFIVEQCLGFLLKDDKILTSEGIMRKPGNNRRMAELQLHFDTRPKVPADFSAHSIHDVAGILKRYIRELPEPLLTLRLQNFFLAAQELTSIDRRLVCMQLLIMVLPKPNRDLLHSILFFLKSIALHSGGDNGSKMDSKNLSIVFGPNLIRFASASSKSSEISIKQVQEEGKEAHELTEFLIDHFEELFSFVYLKICELPLSRGDMIAIGTPPPATAEKERQPLKQVSVPEIEPLTQLQRVKSTSSIITPQKKPNSLTDLHRGNSTSSTLGPLPDISKASLKQRLVLTKTPSASSLPVQKVDENNSSPPSPPANPRARAQSTADSRGARNSLPDVFDSPFKSEYVKSNLSNLSIENEVEDSDEEYASEDDSEYEDPATPIRSPSMTGPVVTIFQGKFMNRTLAQRIESDIKKKTKFVFGDIKLRYAMNINKESRSVPSSPSVDFAVNLDELNIHEVYTKLKEKGVEVKNRRKNLKVIKDCFVGKEAIDWLCTNSIKGKILSRLQARMVAREMLEMGMMEQVFEGEVDFKDDQAYYKFSFSYLPPSSEEN